MKAEKLMLWVFIFCATYILSLELFLKDLDNPFVYLVRLGNIILFLSYNVVASYIFYLIVIYLPKRSKKRKLWVNMGGKALLIHDLMWELVYTLKISGVDYRNFKELDRALRKVNPDLPVNEYENHHLYLFYFKEKLLNIIQSFIIFHEHLDDDYLTELYIIENKLLSQITFDGYKKLAVTNLTYATLTLQDILVHHDIFTKLNEAVMKKNKKIIDKEGAEYRKRNNFDERKT